MGYPIGRSAIGLHDNRSFVLRRNSRVLQLAREPRRSGENTPKNNDADVTADTGIELKRERRIDALRANVESLMAKASEKQKATYNKNRRSDIFFEPGDPVFYPNNIDHEH